MSFDSCAACRGAASGVAATLVGLGVAGVAALGPEDAVVVAIAELFGLDARAVLPMLQGVIAAISGGVDAVAQSLCAATGYC